MADIVVKRIGSAALVQLNRPKALNALNLGMIETLTSAYHGFVREGVKLIVLEGAGGKAFCAGGDVRAIWEDKSGATGRDFFVKEYRLNYLIGSLSIPHVALIHGIVMGGGVGVSVHGKYRVATEKTVFAMPETAIGLFPDVGGSIFLPRLPGHLGAYLGLTGARLKGYETVTAGIATHYVNSEKLEQLKEALLARGPAALEEFGERHSDEAVAELRRGVDRAFAHDTVEEIIRALERDGSPWARATLETLRKVSPTSLKVTLRMLREAPKDREGCFRLEHRLSSHFLAQKDFYEGVRALLVDKTNDAKWSPATLGEVDTDYYFKPSPSDKVLSLL
jgi:enoyl-CoA hydratase/carnithine racemase